MPIDLVGIPGLHLGDESGMSNAIIGDSALTYHSRHPNVTPEYRQGQLAFHLRHRLHIEVDAEGGMPIDLVGIPGLHLGDESGMSMQNPLIIASENVSCSNAIIGDSALTYHSRHPNVTPEYRHGIPGLHLGDESGMSMQNPL
jgi:hypothetical protein